MVKAIITTAAAFLMLICGFCIGKFDEDDPLAFRILWIFNTAMLLVVVFTVSFGETVLQGYF